MLRNSNYSHTFALEPEVELRENVAPDVELSDRDKLCKLIFCPDPRTGLPMSDLGVFMNPQTPAQIREYIDRNLFGDGSVDKTPEEFSALSDDDVAMFVRRSDETSDDYARRISHIMLQERERVGNAFAAVRNYRRSAVIDDPIDNKVDI